MSMSYAGQYFYTKGVESIVNRCAISKQHEFILCHSTHRHAAAPYCTSRYFSVPVSVNAFIKWGKVLY